MKRALPMLVAMVIAAMMLAACGSLETYRFQYGEAITPEKLRRIDAAEAFIRSLGFRQFRVRHHDRLARLELPPAEMGRLFEEGRHEAVVKRFRELGYLYVTLDLQGFRSGSANEILKWTAKK